MEAPILPSGRGGKLLEMLNIVFRHSLIYRRLALTYGEENVSQLWLTRSPPPFQDVENMEIRVRPRSLDPSMYLDLVFSRSPTRRDVYEILIEPSGFHEVAEYAIGVLPMDTLVEAMDWEIQRFFD